MKRTILASILTLVIGFAVGVFFRFHMLPSSAGSASRPTMNTAASPPAQTTVYYAPADTPEPAAPALDRTDNLLLLERANEAAEALRDGDYQALAALIHPKKGVTFTPYSTVDPNEDLCFFPAQIAAAGSDPTLYVWGVTDGKGEPIELTIADYLALYVFNTDYTKAPQIGIDTVLASGNAMENAASVFPQGRFVEYHHPGLDPANMGYDWCSLKLVFEDYQDQWMLVGMIHSEWTI